MKPDFALQGAIERRLQERLTPFLRRSIRIGVERRINAADHRRFQELLDREFGPGAMIMDPQIGVSGELTVRPNGDIQVLFAEWWRQQKEENNRLAYEALGGRP